MKLSKIYIKNFKSIKELEFSFPPSGILVLVGENNSGKSNIIRAIDLVCGESWIGKEKLEDHDHYQRKKGNEIEVDLYFDNDRSVKFSPNDGTKWGVAYFSDWAQTTKMPFGSNSIKEDFPSTYLGADRTLDKHMSFYDWTLIGRIRKAFHKNVDDDVRKELDAKFADLITTFDKVPGFVDFKKDFSDSYSSLLPRFKTQLDVDFQPFTPTNYFKTMQIMGIDPDFADKPLDLSELGEGARNLILIALLKSFAKNFKNNGGESNGILALEEPELFLHPQARRHLFTELKEIAATGLQIIISTHSDSFIDTEFFDEIGRVVKIDDEEEDGKLYTSLVTCSKQNLLDYCIETGVPAGKATLASLAEYYKTTSNPKLNEGFFARYLLLVEGETEELVIPELLSCLDINCNPQGISVIGVNGKNQIPKYWRLYSKFNIPIIVIFDNDNSAQKVSSNNNIATCFGITVDDITNGVDICKLIEPEAHPTTKLVILEQDFETSFRKELTNQGFEGEYDTFEAEAREFIKPIGNQQKGVIARYIVRKANDLEDFNSRIGLQVADLIEA
jgi:putative ATP-dependent endonuclease of OLD family